MGQSTLVSMWGYGHCLCPAELLIITLIHVMIPSWDTWRGPKAAQRLGWHRKHQRAVHQEPFLYWGQRDSAPCKVQEMQSPVRGMGTLWNNRLSRDLVKRTASDSSTQLSLPGRSQEPPGRNLRHLAPASFRGWERFIQSSLWSLLDFCTPASLGPSHSELVSELISSSVGDF